MGNLLRLLVTQAGGIKTLRAPSSTSFAEAMGDARLISGYTGYLYRLYCATATPTTLDIPQDAFGRADESLKAAWSGGSTAIYRDGYYSQVTGEYVVGPGTGRRPLHRNSLGSGRSYTTLSSMGYTDTGTLDLDQGLPSRDISVDRRTTGIFFVTRHMGPGVSMHLGGLETSAAANALFLYENQPAGGNQGALEIAGSSNIGSKFLAPIGQLEILGIVTSASATKLHVGDRLFSSATAMTSQATTKAWMGRGTVTGRNCMGEYAAMIVYSGTPSDSDIAMLKEDLRKVFPHIPKIRKNVCLASPNSLSFNANLNGFNNTPWYYAQKNLTLPVEFVLMGASGRKIADQITQFSDITNIAPELNTADKVHVIIAPVVNDVQSTTSGSTNGDPAQITARATAIYNDCITLKNLFLAIDAKWSVSFDLQAPTGTSFWTGTTQDKLDKPQIYAEAQNQLAATESVIDNRGINITGARPSGDAVHWNETGHQRLEPNITAKLQTVFA